MISVTNDETDGLTSPVRHTAILAAVIVCYRPIPDILQRICSRLEGDGCVVFIVDNTEDPHDGLADLPATCVRIVLRHNSGIARAQNIGVSEATRRGATIIAFFDQDSLIEPGALRALAAHLVPGQPGIVAPACRDDHTGEQLQSERLGSRGRSEGVTAGKSTKPYGVDIVISSGTVATKEVFDLAGGFDESMFIDLVDTEWCLRCRSHGIPINIIPTVVMRHRIGTRSIKFAGRTLLFHDSSRCYYQTRNGIHLLRKPHVPKLYALRWIGRVLASRMILLYHAENRRDYIKAILAGFRDGLMGVGGARPSPAVEASAIGQAPPRQGGPPSQRSRSPE